LVAVEDVMTNLKRSMKAATSFVRLTINPSMLGQVFELSDGVADPDSLRRAADEARRTDAGARALAERPRLRIDLAALAQLAPGTLGREFADHMIANRLDPAALPTLAAHDELEYVRAHLYETHDVWHVVTGFATDVAGELGLQAFYAAQLPGKLPPAILAGGLLNTLLFSLDDKDARLREIARGFLLGKRARPLFGVRWDELWTRPLAEVKRELGLDDPSLEAVMPAAA
jgi:ubiquinone biosynthesis protein Coq4